MHLNSSHPTAGLILCGGQSARMESPKHLLPFGDTDETLLTQVVKTVSQVCEPVLVIAAPDQTLPKLPNRIQIIRDTTPHEGPLAAFVTGLEALPAGCHSVFLCSCDVPFLTADYIQSLSSYLKEDTELVIPRDEQHSHPLAALYRPTLLHKAQALLAKNVRSLWRLTQDANTVEITGPTLAKMTSKGKALINVNSPKDYAAALKILAETKPAEESP